MAFETKMAAQEAAQAVSQANGGRNIKQAVKGFLHVLHAMPDARTGQLPGDTIQTVQALAERVIEHIEQHLYDTDEKHALQRDLARAVYDIREALEEIHRWQRHYGVKA